MSPPRVLALLGPTASGKSAVAHIVARELGGEIVVADPFQRYRGLEVAADSPRAAERAEVAHHCVGDLHLWERSTAGGYAPLAHAAIDAILERGRVPVVSGGTGLYVRAALCDLGFPPEPPAAARARAEELVAADLHRAAGELAARDPARAERVDARNPRRVARALALALAGADAPAEASRLWSPAMRHPTLALALSRPRDELDRRIHARVRRELEDGLVAELEAALDTPGLAREPAQVIGMREVAALRDGALEPSALPDLLDARTRRLARRQMTWLRKWPDLAQMQAGGDDAEAVVDRVLAAWAAARAAP